MRKIYNKETKFWELIPETPLEEVESLEHFFECDLWYAKHAEWKTEADMLKYLHAHFKICKDGIKRIQKEDG